MGKTQIEWAEHVWNPIVGCSVISPGCTNCYAMKQAARLLDKPGAPYEGTTRRVNGHAVWTGDVWMNSEKAVYAPLKRKKPTRWFVNSMGDLFHENAPFPWIDQIFAIMAMSPQHTFLVLTKRADRMRAYMTDMSTERASGRGTSALSMDFMGPFEALRWPLPNVWLGVSVEDQARAEERIPDLLAAPAAVRWVSAEPLLGAVNFKSLRYQSGDDLPAIMRVNDERCSVDALRGISTWPSSHYQTTTIADRARIEDGKLWRSDGEARALDWLVVGGESGPGARPFNPDWARSIRDQCRSGGTPFFMKQIDKKTPIPADLMIREFPDAE